MDTSWIYLNKVVHFWRWTVLELGLDLMFLLVPKYSWLSLSRILDISNFALSRTIHPVTWSFGTLFKAKTHGISNLDISNFCPCQTNFPVPWAVFPSYLKLLPKFPKFLLKLVFFLTPDLCKDSHIDFFFFFFLIKYFDSIF